MKLKYSYDMQKKKDKQKWKTQYSLNWKIYWKLKNLEIKINF